MNTMTPAQVASNRTARLAATYNGPRVAYTSTAQSERTKLLIRADDFSHSGDELQPWCHVCRRPTDHFGEHSDEQLLAFARSPLGKRLMETW
jgi:hypothetical protein